MKVENSDDEMRKALEQRLAATLDRSLQQLDEDVVVRLAQTRRRALRQRHAAVIGLALAAGIAALLLVPRLLPESSPSSLQLSSPVAMQQPSSTLPEEYAHLEVDPELLSDWELLEAIGERPDAS